MASGFANVRKIPELRRRLLFTLALLAVYRIGVFVTTPGVDRAVMSKIINQASGSFLGLFNMFSGGALEQMSIFALGIMPYISASIILQLLTVVVPKLEQIQREGELGRRRLNQYTRYGCIALALVQSFFIARWLIANNTQYGQYGEVVPDPSVHHVAGRADHRARHRQRHLADHLRGHRLRHADRRLPAGGQGPGR
jgi:preprotein translocase subunit SecY